MGENTGDFMEEHSESINRIGPDGFEELSGYQTLKAILNAITATCTDILLDQLGNALKKDVATDRDHNKIMPYFYAAGFLSFAGREIDRKNLIDCITSAGMHVDNNLLSIILDSGIKSHLIYVYASYFLLVNGIRPTSDKLLNVIKSLGMQPDEARAEFVIKKIYQFK
jgi:ribosomal protein L12E/L44/L45/RPP1/RPP2